MELNLTTNTLAVIPNKPLECDLNQLCQGFVGNGGSLSLQAQAGVVVAAGLLALTVSYASPVVLNKDLPGKPRLLAGIFITLAALNLLASFVIAVKLFVAG